MGTLGLFANFIAYAIMGYPAGNMLQKYGYKKTALIAIAVGFTGVGIQTLSGSVESFGVYLLGAFIAGFSMCLLNTVVNPMLNTLGGLLGGELVHVLEAYLPPLDAFDRFPGSSALAMQRLG